MSTRCSEDKIRKKTNGHPQANAKPPTMNMTQKPRSQGDPPTHPHSSVPPFHLHHNDRVFTIPPTSHREVGAKLKTQNKPSRGSDKEGDQRRGWRRGAATIDAKSGSTATGMCRQQSRQAVIRGGNSAETLRLAENESSRSGTASHRTPKLGHETYSRIKIGVASTVPSLDLVQRRRPNEDIGYYLGFQVGVTYKPTKRFVDAHKDKVLRTRIRVAIRGT
ncbi:hypothetical protein K438DRAFT_1765747 [Mycena galopus ATCC 62051]|nr:hypothetical protein K438DRAFT_1765747 [Mycena galopus ATCC 62051]